MTIGFKQYKLTFGLLYNYRESVSVRDLVLCKTELNPFYIVKSILLGNDLIFIKNMR